MITGPLEICDTETFEASCNENEAILITSAKYGRMALGRCISKDYGMRGCSVDVMTIMANLCSGQRSCTVAGANPLLTKEKSAACDKDLAAYLVISYECIPGTFVNYSVLIVHET